MWSTNFVQALSWAGNKMHALSSPSLRVTNKNYIWGNKRWDPEKELGDREFWGWQGWS